LQGGCQRWNDDEFNLDSLNKPLKTKAKINPVSVAAGAGTFAGGYVWVGTQRGSYVDVGLRKKASALPSPVSSCCRTNATGTAFPTRCKKSSDRNWRLTTFDPGLWGTKSF
jgi:hypothetical protein